MQNHNNISADLGHAISFKYGGGLGGLDVLAPNNRNAAIGVSTGLNITIDNFPVYNGNAYLLAHELGHNLGSPHTHSCSWPGGPIDNCMLPEGDCPPGNTPENGGTIMSYCASINFLDGFGSLPGNLIRKKVSAYKGSNITPIHVVVQEIYADQAYLKWEHHYKESKFIVEYKPKNTAQWSTIETINTWLQLTMLSSNTEYDYRIRTECSSYITGTFQTSNTDGYCFSNFLNSGCRGASSYDPPLSTVIIEGKFLSQSSSCNNNNYTLFYPSVKSFQIGKTYDFSIQTIQTMNIAIWVDLNGNRIFEENEKLYFSDYDSQHTGIISGNFTIPNNASILNSTRMRITAYLIGSIPLACSTYGIGEEEDYTIDIVECSVDSLPSGLSLNSMEGDKALVSWTHSSGDPFYVEYKADEDYLWKKLWVDDKVAELNNLLPLTTYIWRVRSNCSPFVEASFTTLKRNYCDLKKSLGDGCLLNLAINKVVLDNTVLSQESGCSSAMYTLFNNLPKELVSGQNYSFSIEQLSSLYSSKAAIWIDVNNNGIFEDSELLFSTSESVLGTIAGNISIPFGIASDAVVRMRIVLQHGDLLPINPCWLYNMGEAEDYFIKLKPCMDDNLQVPSNLMSKGIYDTGAVVSWIGLEDNTYIIEYKKNSSHVWKYAGETSDSFFHINNLSPSNLYEWRVRSGCSSVYATDSFLTKPISTFCRITYSSSSCVLKYGIDAFSIANVNLSNYSSCNSEGYTFFPHNTVDLKVGGTYDFTIRLVEGMRQVHSSAWLDLNDNGTFEDSEMLFLTSGVYSDLITGTLRIPLNASISNSIRLRIVISDQYEIPNSACRSYQLGETEDYLINIVPCTANTLSAPTALKSDNVYDKGAVLLWTYGSSTPFELEYKKNSETSWNSIVVEEGTSFHLGDLSPNTLYQWRVRAYCSVNFGLGSFTTKQANNYCDVSNQRRCNYPYNDAIINSVVLDNTVLSSSSSCKDGAYEFFPYVVKTLEAGKTYTFSLEMLREDSQFWGAYIWLDLNGNESFDSDETLFGTNSTQQGVVSGSITIPFGTQTVLATRLRITVQLFHEDNPLSPCSVLYPEYPDPGETEDYLINIYNPCPAKITLTDPTDNISNGNMVKEASKNYGLIQASNKIAGNADVTYRAKSIELNPGFQADRYTVFKAETGGCN